MMRKTIVTIIEYEDQSTYVTAKASIANYIINKGMKVRFGREIDHDTDLSEVKLFALKSGETYYVINYNDILFFKKELRKIHVYTKNEKRTFYATEEYVLRHTNRDQFIVPCKGYIVNQNKITKIGREGIYIVGSEEIIPISRRHRRAIKEKIKKINSI